MKLLKLWRTFKEGATNFYRNGWLSFATVSVITISLFIMSITIFLVVGSGIAIKKIQSEINVSLYFNPDVKEQRILEIKDTLSGYREIKSIQYITKDQALQNLIESTNNDPFIKEALDEIGTNPLLPSLLIEAQDPQQYEAIVAAVEGSYFRNEIGRIDYERNKKDIARLQTQIRALEKLGFIMGGIFVLVAILIAFNTIRLTIYSQKQELEIMRLVGASNMYIRMPHVFEGIMYGITSSIIVSVLLFITFVFFASSFMGELVKKEALRSFYFQYLGPSTLIIFIAGILLGVVSSFIAIRRYLKI